MEVTLSRWQDVIEICNRFNDTGLTEAEQTENEEFRLRFWCKNICTIRCLGGALSSIPLSAIGGDDDGDD